MPWNNCSIRQGSCELYTAGWGSGGGAAAPRPPPLGRLGGSFGPSKPPQTVKLIAAKRNLVLCIIISPKGRNNDTQIKIKYHACCHRLKSPFAKVVYLLARAL